MKREPVEEELGTTEPVKVDPVVAEDHLSTSNLEDAATNGATYKIGQGDLSMIASIHYDDPDAVMDISQIRQYTEIVAKVNGVENIHDIKAGQTIALPSRAEIEGYVQSHSENPDDWYTPPESQIGIAESTMHGTLEQGTHESSGLTV